MVLLFTDDMVLFAESIKELQDLLDKFHIYCSQWKFKVNPDKTKVQCSIFCDKYSHLNHFSFTDQPLHLVDWFTYLGVV